MSGFLLFSAFLFLIMTVGGVIRAYREKERFFYLSATMAFLMSLVGFLIFLEQILLTILVFAFMGVLTLVTWPKLIRQLDRMYAATIHEVDFSAPLRMRDFFTTKGQLKIASRWGVRKTTLLYWLFLVALTLFIASLLNFVSMDRILVYVIPTSILPTYLLYRGLSKSPRLLEGDLNE